MKYKVSPEACRICLRKSRSCRSIYKPLDKEDMAPCEKLKLISGVNVSQENDDDFPTLPQLICRSCEISLNMAFGLRQKARKSDQILHIYCNRLNKDNIIVELDTGRKFKLSKELTLKVVPKNKQPASPSPLNSTDDSCLEEHFDESYLGEETESIPIDDEIEEIEDEKESLLDEEQLSDVEKTSELVTEEHLYTSDNGDANPDECLKLVTDNDNDEVKIPAQMYNAAEIAKRLEASDKYEVVSWKQEGEKDSVPVFRLRVKGIETKHLTNDFICEVCGNTYRQRHRLTEHMRRHSNEKRYACEICNKRFAIAEGLRRHVLTHGAQKPYKCNYCTRRFYNPSARKAHEIVHSGAKPYVCNICERAFAYTCSLRKHMLIHENKKLYRCNYCDKEFRLQHHLKQHEETQIHRDAIAEHVNSQTNIELLGDLSTLRSLVQMDTSTSFYSTSPSSFFALRICNSSSWQQYEKFNHEPLTTIKTLTIIK